MGEFLGLPLTLPRAAPHRQDDHTRPLADARAFHRMGIIFRVCAVPVPQGKERLRGLPRRAQPRLKLHRRGRRGHRGRPPDRVRHPSLVDARQRHSAEADATVVRIVAEQFAWNVHYPGRRRVRKVGYQPHHPRTRSALTGTIPRQGRYLTINQLNLPSGSRSSST